MTIRPPVTGLCMLVFLATAQGGSSTTELEQQREQLQAELDTLPLPLAGPAGGTLGYASQTTNVKGKATMPKWVSVDLGEVRMVDAVCLAPAWMIEPNRSERTHRFPLQFRVEVSVVADFSESEIIFETIDDFPDPGRHPFWIATRQLQARFVKVTATKLSSHSFGLSELFVFSGNRNVALGRPVSAFDTLKINKNWQNEFLTDGYTPLGDAVGEAHTLRNGYRSAVLPTDRVPSWVEVEWGEEKQVASVAMFPSLVLHNLMAIEGWGQGFPAAFRIEVSNDDDGTEWQPIYEFPAAAERPFPNPVNVAWHQSAPEIPAKRLRVTSTRHRFDPTTQAFYFSLSELQVHDIEGENVAAGATVRASHPPTTDDPWPGADWKRDRIVDGLSGYGRLIPLREWLTGLDRRRELLRELEMVEAAIPIARVREQERVRLYIYALTAALLGGIVFFAARLHRSRLREANLLRERIANDLHDEVGSTLGSIALNADVLSRKLSDEPSGERLSQMAVMARNASQTMRDLVWVVDHRTDDSVHLLERLRETTSDLLGDMAYRFEAPEPFPKVNLSPEQKRHLLLFLKEALHNAMRHAEASEVVIRISPSKDSWEISVADDGNGFEFDAEDNEQLDRLRARARRLDGAMEVKTKPGQGTRIELTAPIG